MVLTTIQIITGVVLIVLILALIWMFIPSDTSKSDSPKSDTSKSDSPKSDSPKSDSPKSDSPKSDSPKIPLGGKCTSKTNLLDADGKKTKEQVLRDNRCAGLGKNICNSKIKFPHGGGNRCNWA